MYRSSKFKDGRCGKIIHGTWIGVTLRRDLQGDVEVGVGWGWPRGLSYYTCAFWWSEGQDYERIKELSVFCAGRHSIWLRPSCYLCSHTITRLPQPPLPSQAFYLKKINTGCECLLRTLESEWDRNPKRGRNKRPVTSVEIFWGIDRAFSLCTSGIDCWYPTYL